MLKQFYFILKIKGYIYTHLYNNFINIILIKYFCTNINYFYLFFIYYFGYYLKYIYRQ